MMPIIDFLFLIYFEQTPSGEQFVSDWKKIWATLPELVLSTQIIKTYLCHLFYDCYTLVLFEEMNEA